MIGSPLSSSGARLLAVVAVLGVVITLGYAYWRLRNDHLTMGDREAVNRILNLIPAAFLVTDPKQ